MQIDTVYIISAFVAIGGAVALLFKLLLASKDRELALIKDRLDAELKEMVAIKKTYQDVASEAVRSATETTNFYRAKEGKPPLIIPIPVIAEGNSPSTEKQRESARQASMRATMAALKLQTGQAPREEPGHDQRT